MATGGGKTIAPCIAAIDVSAVTGEGGGGDQVLWESGFSPSNVYITTLKYRFTY